MRLLYHAKYPALARGASLAAAVAGLAAGCAGEKHRLPGPTGNPQQARAVVERALPPGVTDRSGWTTDIDAALVVLAIPETQASACAVAAVIEQESGFHTDPIVANLPAIAWRTIDERAAAAGVPRLLVHGALQAKSSNGRSYAERIDHASTEKELSDVYEDFIGSVPLGRTLLADHNPIRTRGPMQVQVTFAERFAAAHPYPYPVKDTLADEVFTRRGGVYFGVAHLLAYPTSYDDYLYRFADFNAGQYASRNAAFQSAVSIATGIRVVGDGALLPHESTSAGATEVAVRTLSARLGLGDGAIHSALEQGRTDGFAQSPLYQRIFSLAERREGHALPRALLPTIDLRGPKISRRLTTDWYAHRVNDRFQRCLAR